MEKEKSRGRTRRKQPSRITSFLVHEGRRWCAAALSLCLILNNMTGVAWAAETASEDEVLFKLTSSSLYEALQEAVREENTVDENFLFAGKEKDVEAYEKLLLLDDDLYELKPKFEQKDEAKDKEVELRIFASLSWETDPEKEYQVVGDEKIIFFLSNTSEIEQTAVIQVDEQKTDTITVVPKSAVVIDGEGEAEILESETLDAGEAEETEEAAESEGQTGEENADFQDSEAGKKPGSSGTGGSGSGSGSGGGASGVTSETESKVQDESGSVENSREPALDSEETEAEKEKAEDRQETDKETEAKEEKETQEDKTDNEKTDEGKTDDIKNDESEKTDEGKHETDKEESGKDESAKEESGKNEEDKTEEQDKGQSTPEASEKNDKEDLGSSDKADSTNDSGHVSDSSSDEDKGSSEKESSDKVSKEKGSSDKGSSDKVSEEKGSSDKESTDKEGSDKKNSDEGTEVSAGISRNRIRLVTDNLEEKTSDETFHADEASASDAEQEKHKDETKAEAGEAETASASDAEGEEIEGELYEAVVMNEESVIVFITTAKELKLNNPALRKASDSNAEHITPAFEKEIELENVIVQVRADENVLPEGVTLQVKELKEEGEHAEQYEEAKEALDSKGTAYDGMMALDISFLDRKGREIEPDGNVQVSIKVKKEALPEAADLESIAVQHLAEEEGEIFVEEVADCGDKTRGKVEVEAEEHVEAAFEVGSFSVFTVTWRAHDGNAEVVKFNLQFWCIGNGEPQNITQEINYPDKSIEIYDDDVIKETQNTESWIFPMEEYVSVVQGYSYDHVEFETEPFLFNKDGSGYYSPVVKEDHSGLKKGEVVIGTVDTIKVKKIAKNPSGMSFEFLVEVGKKNEKDPVICPSVCLGDKAEITLNIYYREAGVGILETIAENGRLTASYDLEDGQSYVWYKWNREESVQCPEITDENGKKIRDPQYQVSMRPVAGNKWNLESGGKILNAVHDGGANHYYLVAIKDNAGNEIMASSPFLMDYSDEIVNGSFESPDIGSVAGGKYHFFDRDANGLVWKSTTAQIELVNENSTGSASDEHCLDGKGRLPDGKQCAELNAHHEGALYQDVLTVPGATLHWSLYHRARGNGIAAPRDTMYVVIMPTETAEQKLNEFANNVRSIIDDINNNPGSYSDSTRVWELTSPRAWTFYTNDYVVGEDQYFTRFFFVAGDTATKSGSVGNLLDDIRFGSNPPAIAQGGVSIKKMVRGLSDDKMKDYDLTIKLNKIDDSYAKDIKLEKFTTVNDVYSEVKSVTDLSAGEYIIEEILTDKEKPQTISIEQVELVNGTEIKTSLPVQYTKEGNPQVKITIETGKLTSIQITNSYVQPSDSFMINKVFKNGSGKEFEPDDVSFSDVEFGLYAADDDWKPMSETPLNRGKVQLDDKDESSNRNEKDVTGIVEFSSLREGYYLLREISWPTGYKQAEDRKIFVGKIGDKPGVYLYNGTEYIGVNDKDNILEIENFEDEKLPDIPGTILPDTGGPGLAMFERYGWFLLMLALLMAGVEVRCYGERKYRRTSVMQHEEIDDPL